MKEDQLKDLFAGFNPPMGDDNQFMSKLERNLQAVEFAKIHCAEARRKNRVAVIVASIVGFVCGVVFTLCYPYLLGLIDGFKDVSSDVAWAVDKYGDVMVWAVCSIATCVLTYASYDISQIALTLRSED